MRGISGLAENLSAAQEGLCAVELVSNLKTFQIISILYGRGPVAIVI
jgi:hypothetical protein